MKMIKSNQCIEINYQPFDKKPLQLIFQPYFLKQYNNRWFIYGHNPDLNKIINLGLDRIISFTKIDQKYICTLIDFNEYFEDIIGVTFPENQEAILIKLAFSASQAPYITTKPIHGSQRTIKQTEKELIISIEVIPNYELEQLLLFLRES